MAFVLNENKSLIKEVLCVCMCVYECLYVCKEANQISSERLLLFMLYLLLAAYCFALSSSYTTACVLIINNKRHRARRWWCAIWADEKYIKKNTLLITVSYCCWFLWVKIIWKKKERFMAWKEGTAMINLSYYKRTIGLALYEVVEFIEKERKFVKV